MLRLLGLALLFAIAQSGRAQYVVSARAGTINFITGQVSVDDKIIESGVERAPIRGPRKPTKFPTLRDGQLLRTDDGRAEVLLGPGVFLRLGPHAALRMVNSRLTDTQVKLEQGAALVEVIQIANGSNVHVLLGGSRTTFRGIGLHRFDADSGDLSVYGGHADITAGAQTFDATRGHVIHLLDPPTAARFDPREKDPLLQWAAARSFRLYISNPAARERLSNWEVSNATYYFNRDFGVQFISHTQTFPLLAPPVFAPPVFTQQASGDSQSTPGQPKSPANPGAVTYPGPASGGNFHY